MSTKESLSFDPYHRWLGISPKDRPANHYRLLGVDVFESDLDVIESAADRQMTHVRSFQTGQHAKLTQQILNELSTAKVCLLNKEKKSTYDKQLRAELASQFALSSTLPAATLPVAPAPQMAVAPQLPAQVQQPLSPSVSMPNTQTPAVAIKPTQRALSHGDDGPVWARPQVWIPAAAVVGGFVIILAAVIVFRPSNNTDDQAAESEENNVEVPMHEGEHLTEPAHGDSVTGNSSNATRQVDSPPPSAEVGADVEVARMKMVSFGIPQKLPESPSTAYGFDWITKPKSADVKDGVLEFTVKKDGLVYLVTSTKYEGNRSGGWWEERVTSRQLVEQGWESLGSCPWNSKKTMLKRMVKADERYRIRTNKYGPPSLIIPGPIAGQKIGSGSAPTDTKPLVGQHILRLGEKGGIELAKTKGMFRHDRDWTIELLARLDPNTNALILVGDRVVGGHRDIQEPDGGFMVRCQKSRGNYFAEVPFTSGSGIRQFQLKANEWQHFAVTSDTEQLRFFVNGKLVTERKSDPNDWKPGPVNLHIGFHPYLFWSVSHGFNGDLRAVRISSTCMYREAFTPPAQFTKAKNSDVFLSFSNPRGDRIEDLSGNGHYGLITDGQWIPQNE